LSEERPEPGSSWLQLGQLKAGWQTVSFELAGERFEFNVSYLENSPLHELTTAALWLLVPDYGDEHELLAPPNKNPPLSGPGYRCIHFLREPEWHPLKVNRLCSDEIQAEFFVRHEGWAGIREADLQTAERRVVSQMQLRDFCEAVSLATQQTNVPMHNTNWGQYPTKFASTLYSLLH